MSDDTALFPTQARCKNCKYLDHDQESLPFCRRYPPTLVVVKPDNEKDNGVRKYWPVVSPADDWCGEYKHDNEVN